MPAINEFLNYSRGLESPGSRAFAITPSDSVDLPYVIRGLYVGVTGNVTYVDLYGTTVTKTAMAAGMTHPMQAVRIMATLTTATNMVGES